MKIIEIAEDNKPKKKGFKVDVNAESTICTIAKDTNVSGLEQMKDASIKLYKEKVFQVIDKIKELKLPKSKEQLRLITRRSFNAVSFLKFIAEQEKVLNLICCIYSINHEAAMIIDELIKQGRIENATLLISNLRNKAHREKEQLTKDLFVDNPKIKLIYASSHSKIMSFETEKENYYTIEGSGNLSFNSRIEQYVIDNDKDLFEFTNKWTAEIVEYLKGKKELTTYNL